MGNVWGIASSLVFLIFSSRVSAHSVIEIAAGKMVVRAGPGPNFPKLGEVFSKQRYYLIHPKGAWKKIWFGQQVGWIYGSSVLVVGGPAAKVLGSNPLTVRSGPSWNYSEIGKAPPGSRWAVAGKSGNWINVHFAGKSAWMASGYLSTSTSNANPNANWLELSTSSVGFTQLPAGGAGYYSYSSSSRQWGKPGMIYGLMNAAGRWKMQHPQAPRIGVGDISLKHGGYMSGHVSHRKGIDVDIRPIRKDNIQGPTRVGWSSYSRARTYFWIASYVKKHLNIQVVIFNDPKIYGPLWYVIYWPNHHNHLHVRIWP